MQEAMSNEQLLQELKGVTVMLLIYLVIAMACMIIVTTGCSSINHNPESNKPWLIVVPAFIIQMAVLILTLNTLFR